MSKKTNKTNGNSSFFQMYQLLNDDTDAKLKERLDKVQHGIYVKIKPYVMAKADVTTSTLYNVLQGKSKNLPVLMQLANFFKVGVEDILNPSIDLSRITEPDTV